MSLYSFLLFIACLLSFQTRGEGQDGVLRIRFLVPLESDANRIYHTESTVPAAMMAVDDINNNPDYLPGYKLVLDVSDTQCDQSEGTWQMISSVLETNSDNVSNIIAFVGGSCSIVAEPTAALSGRLYKVVQVSYGAASPILSEPSMYPLFYRTYPSLNMFNEVYFALMNTYGWCISATLHQTVNLFSLSVEDFHNRFNQVLNSSTTSRPCSTIDDQPILFSFTGDPEIPLRQIKNKDVRIIYGYFYEDLAIIVMCYAKHMDLTDDKYLWIIPGWYTKDWWKLADTTDWSGYKYNCTSEDIKEAIDYSLLVDFYTLPLDENAESLSGYTTAEFYDTFNQYLEQYEADNDKTVTTVAYETLAYDAIWTVAIALNKTENVINQDWIFLDDFEYSKAAPDQDGLIDDTQYDDTINNIITNNLSSFIQSASFKGVSGDITFDEYGDPSGYSIIYQYRVRDGELMKERLGLYNMENNNYTIPFDRVPEWKTDGPPTDRRTPDNKTLSPGLVIGVNFFVALAIILCVFILVFNTVTIYKPLIKNSGPLMNTIIIIGCLMLLCASVLMGIDSNNPIPEGVKGDLILREIPQNGVLRYEAICTIRLWLLTIGFTLSFGALFAKTLQVYRVYTNPKLKEQAMKIWNFLILMGVQLFLDILFLSIWTGLYRFRREIDEKTKGNKILIFEYCDCDNFSYLIGALYVYKGLLAIFGLFLAYESRNVKYLYINDSRFVSIAMYIVVILIGIGAPLSLVFAGQRLIDPAYGVAAVMIVTACTSCLLILYVPKFYYIFKGADTMIPKAKLETFTPVDKLQLGRSEVNPEDLQNVDKELKELKEQVEMVEQNKKKDLRRGSDQDSGVHCDTNDNNNSPTTTNSGDNDDAIVTMETNLSSIESGKDMILEENEDEEPEVGTHV